MSQSGGARTYGRRFLLSFLLANLFLVTTAPAADEPEALFFDPFGAAPYQFRIAFWRDPDAAALASLEKGDPLHERLKLFAGRLIRRASDVLLADSFGSLSVTLIEDYERLYDERWTWVNYNLLHCDPAIHMEGRGFPLIGSLGLYELFLEQVPLESAPEGAGIWVKRDSPIRSVDDLVNRHIARVHSASLFGGGLQRAELARRPGVRLRQGYGEGTGDYQATNCGSASEAIFRLLTGLASERPIEAAFLPLSGPGFSWVLRTLKLRTMEDLPIRLLERYEQPPFPGFPLLLARYPEVSPPLRARLEEVFLEETAPFQWRVPSLPDWNALAERMGATPEHTETDP